jgi:ribosomal protein S18 acetylase RimI-like enzyme
MFVDAALAARIDRVEARLSIAVASAVGTGDAAARIAISAVDDGAAVFARPGSPINKVIGVGFAGPLDAALLDSIEATWRDRDEPVRVELATLASTDAAAQLSARGYRMLGFEHVLVRSLASVPAPAEDIRVAADRDDAAWMRVLVDGFSAGDGTGQAVDSYARDAIEQVMRDFGAAAGFVRYVAHLDGEPVGAATMRIDDGIALLCGATTLPAARRRGVQGALLATRLADARAAGCEFAVVTTAPGSLSQHNTMRNGFVLGYARAILVRAAPSA